MSIQGIEMQDIETAARARHHIRLQEIEAARRTGQTQASRPKLYDRVLANLGDGLISVGLRLKQRKASATAPAWQIG